ncbi:MAG: ATP-dependent RNA helicase [Erysipelotrichaceae bacterium]|nr:MAG: ATP-dependent RNA [Erysipelotrichaceae bacterium]TXT17341.1 MAG: ATP-dependent RNA helicase [Erysipelotrichaceae bacterium]
MKYTLTTLNTVFGFKESTSVQESVFPLAIAGKDLIAVSKTGTGKTHAYLFPLFNLIDTSQNETQALILVPTLELAKQVFNMIQPFKTLDPKLSVKMITKGSDKINPDTLKSHIVIGTLGRLKAMFIEENVLQIQRPKVIVIDEADMMLEKSTIDDLDALMDKIKAQHQTLVFSATVPDNLKSFIKKYLKNPEQISIDHDVKFDPKIKHFLIPLKHRSSDVLFDLFNVINPYIALIFLNNLDELNKLSNAFNDKGMKHIVLHGKLSARERTQNLTLIRNQQVSYVLTTDLAARGIDIPEISDVISIGLPKDLDFYIHRAGRTGRTGRNGQSYIFYTVKDDQGIRQLIERGIYFEHRNLADNSLREMKPYGFKFTFRKKEADKAIARIVNQKKVAVKPNYKKKKEQEIESIKRKARRVMIKKSIKEQQHIKSKISQIEKGNQPK